METKQKKQLWQRERPQTCIHNLLSTNLDQKKKHTAQHNNKRRQAPAPATATAPAPVPAQATTNSAICAAKEKKGLHKNGKQNLGYEPHDVIIHELNSYKHT